MKPIRIITIYSNKTNNNRKYFESAPVVEKSGKLVVGDKSPMTMNELRIFSKAFNSSGFSFRIKDKPFQHVFYVNIHELLISGINKNNLRMIWYTPKGIENLFFSKSNSIKSGAYHLPALVWSYEYGQMSVFASIDDHPRLESKLYHAPLMNISANGILCTGSTKFNIESADSIEQVKINMTRGFFRSEFTHFSNGTKNPMKLYGKMKKDFVPEKDLVPLNKTVNDLFK